MSQQKLENELKTLVSQVESMQKRMKSYINIINNEIKPKFIKYEKKIDLISNEISLKLSKIENKIKEISEYEVTCNTYINLGEFSPEYVFNLIVNDPEEKDDLVIVDEYGHKVHMNSIRYKVFANNTRCVKCGLEGTLMELNLHERQRTRTPHFNLYGIRNNKKVLMTMDHIIPVSKGGKTHLSNLQTMCCTCNHKKADKIETKGEPSNDDPTHNDLQ